ncbi:GMC oxidoreductase-like protein [Sesbania bispinosa]|nr:GMC oxidoreductase-like protein [Sesbania bispinosa]
MCPLSCVWSRGRCLSFLVKEASCACCAIVFPAALCSLLLLVALPHLGVKCPFWDIGRASSGRVLPGHIKN